MLETNTDEVYSSFKAAKNLNAALKTLLKRESKKGDPIEGFVKDFRPLVQSENEARVKEFIEKNFSKREMFFYALARYAHPEFYTSVIEKIFNSYAEEFNATYEKKEEGIEVTKKDEFKKIVKEVVKLIDEELKAAGLPVTNFFKKSVMVCVFEADVLREVVKVLAK